MAGTAGESIDGISTRSESRFGGLLGGTFDYGRRGGRRPVQSGRTHGIGGEFAARASRRAAPIHMGLRGERTEAT